MRVRHVCHWACLIVVSLLRPEFAIAETAGPRVVAHRGLLQDAPENTLVNIEACLGLRLGFELDVRRAKDGALVCVHDETVNRTTSGQGAVNALTLTELQQLDAGSWFGEKFEGERIPTLDAVFATVAKANRPSVLIAVDIKGEDAKIEADIVTLALKHQVLDQLLMIGRTIDQPNVRKRLHAASSQVHAGCLANNSSELDAAISDQHSDWVYVRFIPSREEAQRAHAAGKRVFIAGATVAGHQMQNWRRLAAVEVDGILTDYSIELARQLRQDAARIREIKTALQPHYAPPAEYRGEYGKYPSPLVDPAGNKITKPAEWQRQQQQLRAEWLDLLGGWPPLLPTPRIKFLASKRRENFTQHQVEVEIYPGEKYTEGHLLVPDGPGPFPAVLVTFYDSLTSVGLGAKGKGTHDYGAQLARRGFVTLSIGTPGSLEAPEKQTRQLLTEAGEQQRRQPLGFLAYVAANCHTALANLPNVDGQRVGVVGLSYGGKWSMFASCLYEKFHCAVWSDPGIVFNEANSNVNYWEPWYLGYEAGTRRPAGVPNAERPRTGLYKRLYESGRDLNGLHALICPRPVLLAGGTEDPPQNWRVLNHLIDVNKLLGVQQHVAMTHRPTHVPTPEALETTLMFLEYHLKYQ